MIDENKYRKAIEELFERHQSVQNAGFSPAAYKPGLEAMLRLDKALGEPSKAFRSIHIAGTNGKGSVCTMLSASLACAGQSVGLYTSPHLLDFRERIKIISADGYEMISKEEVLEFLKSDLKGLSFFEVTTGMAFWWFAKRQIDVAVIETGLGGRLDSTNIITPTVSVVTSIGLDHCAILGNTRAAIAAEKAGIFKRGVPAIVWGHDPETDPVFETKAGACLQYADGSGNEATALKALEAAKLPYRFKGLTEASKQTGFRGRWERIGNAILDIGHNPQALERNFGRLCELTPEPTIVYGVMADKDYRTIAQLFPVHATVYLTQPLTPRALPLPVLEEAFRELRPDLAVEAAPGVDNAVREALARAEGRPVYIGGSTYVVCEAIEYLENGKIQH